MDKFWFWTLYRFAYRVQPPCWSFAIIAKTLLFTSRFMNIVFNMCCPLYWGQLPIFYVTSNHATYAVCDWSRSTIACKLSLFTLNFSRPHFSFARIKFPQRNRVNQTHTVFVGCIRSINVVNVSSHLCSISATLEIELKNYLFEFLSFFFSIFTAKMITKWTKTKTNDKRTWPYENKCK